jgi:hypothetical protein
MNIIVVPGKKHSTVVQIICRSINIATPVHESVKESRICTFICIPPSKLITPKPHRMSIATTEKATNISKVRIPLNIAFLYFRIKSFKLTSSFI